MSFYKKICFCFCLVLLVNFEVKCQNHLAGAEAPKITNVEPYSKVEFNGLMLNGIKPNQLNSYPAISKFKKNKRLINYTALGFVAAGVTIGGIYTLACKQRSFGQDQCTVGVFVGTVLGVTGGALTLLIAHPINRIANKKNDQSLYLDQYPSESDVTVSVGFVGNGFGLGLMF